MKRSWRSAGQIGLIVTGTIACAIVARGDEGMWLFSDPPRELLKQKYAFEPTEAWLEHLQRASIRFNNGGSGSFVSADGLVMTNHHVGADAVQKLSTKEKDYLKDGFCAATRRLNVVWAILCWAAISRWANAIWCDSSNSISRSTSFALAS